MGKEEKKLVSIKRRNERERGEASGKKRRKEIETTWEIEKARIWQRKSCFCRMLASVWRMYLYCILMRCLLICSTHTTALEIDDEIISRTYLSILEVSTSRTGRVQHFEEKKEAWKKSGKNRNILSHFEKKKIERACGSYFNVQNLLEWVNFSSLWFKIIWEKVIGKSYFKIF